jgi:hypothetical protein
MARCMFWFDEMKPATQVQGNYALNMARNLPVGLQFTCGTRILSRPDVLRGMPTYLVTHVFLTLQWKSLGTALLEVHESQRDVHLRKLIFQMLLCGECYETVYT